MSSPSWKALANNQSWIKFSDTKAGTLIAIDGVLGAAIIHILPQWNSEGKDIVAMWMLLAAAVSLFLSLSCAIISLTPITKHGAPKSVIFFGDIYARFRDDLTGFKNEFQKQVKADPDLLDDVLSQVWATSRIASVKFRLVKYSVESFGIALTLAGIAAVIIKI